MLLVVTCVLLLLPLYLNSKKTTSSRKNATMGLLCLRACVCPHACIYVQEVGVVERKKEETEAVRGRGVMVWELRHDWLVTFLKCGQYTNAPMLRRAASEDTLHTTRSMSNVCCR